MTTHVQYIPGVHFGTRVQSPLQIVDDTAATNLPLPCSKRVNLLKKHSDIKSNVGREILIRMHSVLRVLPVSTDVVYEYMDIDHLPELPCDSKLRALQIHHLHSRGPEKWAPFLMWLKRFPNLLLLVVLRFEASSYAIGEMSKLCTCDLQMVYMDSPGRPPWMKQALKAVNRARFFVYGRAVRWFVKKSSKSAQSYVRVIRSNSEPTGQQSTSILKYHAAPYTSTVFGSFSDFE